MSGLTQPTSPNRGRGPAPEGQATRYLADLLGEAAAALFLSAVERLGGMRAADLLRDSKGAEHALVFDAAGRPRTVADIYRLFAEDVAPDGGADRSAKNSAARLRHLRARSAMLKILGLATLHMLRAPAGHAA